MAQGRFTKQEATASLDALSEIFDALSKKKQGEFLGHLNDVSLFIEEARREAPTERKQKGT